MTANTDRDAAVGTTRTFSPPGRSATIICFGLMLLIVAPFLFTSAARQSGLNAWGGLAVLGSLSVVAGAGIATIFRTAVIVSNGIVTIRRALRSRTVNADEIRSVTLEKVQREEFLFWIPMAELASGEFVSLNALGCGIASKPPKPARLAELNDFMALIGLGAITQAGDAAPESLREPETSS